MDRSLVRAARFLASAALCRYSSDRDDMQGERWKDGSVPQNSRNGWPRRRIRRLRDPRTCLICALPACRSRQAGFIDYGQDQLTVASKDAQAPFQGFEHRFGHFCWVLGQPQFRNGVLLKGDVLLNFGDVPISLGKVSEFL